jgi:hypothetical protein
MTTYEVGPDISPERYNAAILAIADWFAKIRKTDEPVAAAKYALDCCLRGVKLSDGVTPWTTMATATLNSRVRSACRFDLNKMQPLVTTDEKRKARKEREKELAKVRADKAKVDKNLPVEYRKQLAGEATYGDDPLVFFTTKELERRESLKAAYLQDFPQLRSVASESKLDMLLDLTLMLDRMRFRQAKNDKDKATELQMQALTKQIVELEKALNIHPDQLAKQAKDKEGGTIGEAVRRLDEAHPIELRERWFAEELLVLFQMYHTPSPRHNMGGHQLDEVGLFGLTRCRTCSCATCGTKNYAGLKVEEIETWLGEKGFLREVPNDEPPETDDEAEAAEAAEPEAVEGDDARD